MEVVIDLVKNEKAITEAFHKILYHSGAWQTTWLRVPIAKNPLDLWIFQQIIVSNMPDLIIETGTGHGGSALYMAMIMDGILNGRIATVDIEEKAKEFDMDKPPHPRIKYLVGESASDDIVMEMSSFIQPNDKVMVVLDSDHRADNVRRELELYAPLVTPGQFLIVEDTDVNGHPIEWDQGPGPTEALEEWLPQHPEFEVARDAEYFKVTFHPNGFLRRIS